MTVQEYKKSRLVFLVEWLALFGIAWFFWSVIFTSVHGSVPPGVVATLISILYATCIVYGRLLRVTGCAKCRSPLPFLRKEIGRRHLPDQEQCVEVEYGGEEWGQRMIQVYCRVCHSDIITYQCRHCDQIWEEKVELPGTGYQLVRRIDPPNEDLPK